MKLKIVAMTALVFVAPLGALAQNLTAQGVLDKLTATSKSLKDVTARLTGTTNTVDQKLKLDIELKAITASSLVRIKFNAPDSLADNFIIMDKDKVSNYLFLTNQVTVSSKNKATIAGMSLDFSKVTDISALFPADQVNLKIARTEDTPAGKAYVLEATPKAKSNLAFAKATVWIVENGWRPYRIVGTTDKGDSLDLTVVQWKANGGLKEKDLRAIPKDAEIIKR